MGPKVLPLLPPVPGEDVRMPQVAQQKLTAEGIRHRFGNEYFLAQVWEQGSNIHRDLQNGTRARELASSGERMESVTVLASASYGSQ